MAIEKSLYAAPEGMEGMQGVSPDMEIEIVNPEMVTLDDGSVEITIIPEDDTDGVPFDANLVDYMDDRDLAQIAGDLLDAYENDVASRRDWEETYTEGIKLLGVKSMRNVLNHGRAPAVYTTL